MAPTISTVTSSNHAVPEPCWTSATSPVIASHGTSSTARIGTQSSAWVARVAARSAYDGSGRTVVTETIACANEVASAWVRARVVSRIRLPRSRTTSKRWRIATSSSRSGGTLNTIAPSSTRTCAPSTSGVTATQSGSVTGLANTGAVIGGGGAGSCAGGGAAPPHAASTTAQPRLPIMDPDVTANPVARAAAVADRVFEAFAAR